MSEKKNGGDIDITMSRDAGGGMHTVPRWVFEASDGTLYLRREECEQHEREMKQMQDSRESTYRSSCVQVNRYKDKKLPDVMRRYLDAKREAYACAKRYYHKGKMLRVISDKFERAGELLLLMQNMEREYRIHRDFVSREVGMRQERRKMERKARVEARHAKVWRKGNGFVGGGRAKMMQEDGRSRED